MIVRKAGKRLISYTVFNLDDTLMLNKPYIGDMDLIKHDSEQTRLVFFLSDRKKTNPFSYVIGHWIGDKGRLN